LDQPNYLANQKYVAVDKYDLTLFIRLFKSSSRALQDVHFSRVHSSLPVDPLDMTAAPHPRFPVLGCILSTGGDTRTYTQGPIVQTSPGQKKVKHRNRIPRRKNPPPPKKKLRNTQAPIVQNSPGQKKVNIEDRIPRRKKPEGRGRKNLAAGWLAGSLVDMQSAKPPFIHPQIHEKGLVGTLPVRARV
jgi:hypothetical protein